MNGFFGTHPPPAISLVPCLFFAFIVYTSSEYFKAVRKSYPDAFGWLQY